MIARAHRRGGRGPSLVYVPGIDGSGELLLGTAARLEQGFDLLRLRYEAEPTPQEGDSYAALAASVLAVFDEEGLRAPLVLAESFGVALALRLALDAPDRVRGLALVNGFAHYRRRSKPALSQALLPLVPSWLFRLVRRHASPWALLGPRRTPALVEAFQGAPLAVPGPGYGRRLALLRHVNLLDELPRVSAPTDVFGADRDRVVDAVRAGRAIAERVPEARFTLLPNAGHLVLPLPEEPWLERLLELDRRAGGPA